MEISVPHNPAMEISVPHNPAMEISVPHNSAMEISVPHNSAVEIVKVERLDHLGIIAGVIKDLEIRDDRCTHCSR